MTQALNRLASNNTTLALMALLTVAVIAHYQNVLDRSLLVLGIPTLLLVLQFFVAMAVRRVFFDNLPLLVFHFSLLGLALLAFIGQMTFLKGTLELATHERFEGRLENVQRGPWHNGPLDQVRFTNLGFSIQYHTGIKRDRTINRIQRTGPDGKVQLIEIGDHTPLIVGHYRFYTTHNKGYAPVFEWLPAGSQTAVVGSIHLPTYPIRQFEQALEWTMPGTELKLWTHLKIDEEVLPEDRPFDFTIPRKHRLVVRFQDQRVELKPGGELVLPEGVLRYRHLSSWMGYKLDYDWSRPWMLALSMVGIIALAVHFVIRGRHLPQMR